MKWYDQILLAGAAAVILVGAWTLVVIVLLRLGILQ